MRFTEIIEYVEDKGRDCLISEAISDAGDVTWVIVIDVMGRLARKRRRLERSMPITRPVRGRGLPTSERF